MKSENPGRTIAFDLDGTLCTLTNGEYTGAKPILERIEKVNKLKKTGNVILIFTARGATSGKDWATFTETQLASWGVNYDRLIMGKPHFDLLVDDKAISSDNYFEGLQD